METTAVTPGGEQDPLVRQLQEMLTRRIAADSVQLSPLPTNIRKCLAILRNADFDQRELCAAAEADVVIAARVVRLATSAAYGAPGQAGVSLSAALARLGAKAVRALLLEMGAAKLFVSKDQGIDQATQRMWKHSRVVAMMARDIRALSGGAGSEDAYLVGLLHDIGKPVLACILLAAEHEVVEVRGRGWVESARWNRIIRDTHRSIGCQVAERWQLPSEISKAIAGCADYDLSDRGSIGNLVCYANALSKTIGLGSDVSQASDEEEANTLVMIGNSLLGLDEALVKGVVANVRTRVDEP